MLGHAGMEWGWGQSIISMQLYPQSPHKVSSVLAVGTLYGHRVGLHVLKSNLLKDEFSSFGITLLRWFEPISVIILLHFRFQLN